MTTNTILFLAANPSGTDPRPLEARSIRAELKRSGFRDRFAFETRWAAEPLDLMRELRELKPTVVHFSGRGSPDGLVFQATESRAPVVSPAAIAGAFGAAGGSVKVVVLSACFSEQLATALLAHVDCVVGMGGSIHEDAARSFAIGFYGALGESESVEAAYQQGCAAINLTGLSEIECPQLAARTLDAAQLVPAEVVEPERPELPCPYPGMRPYSPDDAAHFHGRSAQIEDLLFRLGRGEREIYVIGPAGSGKSSVVAAGLLPRLARGVSGLGSFVVRTMRPGDHPMLQLRKVLEAADGELETFGNAIADLLAHRAARASVLIVIDQLEELFTMAATEERVAFLTSLQHLRPEPRCVVISTLRADFFGELMDSPLWRDKLSYVVVGALHRDALREAIVQPAQDLGVTVEPALVERLLADAGSEPGILPLLQQTLVELWERRQDQRIALADYVAPGDGTGNRLAVALTRTADATLRALDPAYELLARRILLRLVSFGEGRADTRRQQPRSKLRAAEDDPADFDRVLWHLIDHRLLTADDVADGGEPRVDLAHEVMITAWPTLASWLETLREHEQTRRRLEVDAAQWVEHGGGAAGLLDPVMLLKVEAWRQTPPARELGESADVAQWVAASRDKEVETRRRQARWLAGVAGVGLILLLAVIAVTAIWVAHDQEQELRRDVLGTNAYAAHALAGGVAFRLREEVDATVAIAADPAVVQALHTFEATALEQWRLTTRFDTVALYDRSGIARVQASPVTHRNRNLGKDYSWRDYFRGARRLGEAGLRAGYISRALLSESENIWVFGIAAPVYDEGVWAGVLLITVGTDAALKQERLDRASDDGPMAVIVAPRDRSRATTEGEGEYVVILHDGLTHGAGIAMDSPRLRELRGTRTERNQLRWIDPDPITDDSHCDPVPGFEGRWLAGFAPVGETGFVVIVQTRHDAALKSNTRLSRRLTWGVIAVILAWLAACSTFLWVLVRRRRSLAIGTAPRRPSQRC